MVALVPLIGTKTPILGVLAHGLICERNQKPLVQYFIGSRHKNCSVIYLSQSYYLTPKDIRLNCSHFCIFDSPSANDTARMCREVNVPKIKSSGLLQNLVVLRTLIR